VRLRLVCLQVWPYFEAERTAYRFRILDASNYRTYNLTFVCAAKEDYPYFYLPLKGTIVPFTQVSVPVNYSTVDNTVVLIAFPEPHQILYCVQLQPIA